MPVMCDYTWTDSLDVIIREEVVIAGVPLDLAYALIAVESGFDPNAHNLTQFEDSVGLLQLNRMGGQGQGYTVEELKDPRRNLQIGLPYIARAFAASWSPDILPYEFIWLVSVRSGHPGDVARDDYRIRRIAQVWGCFFPAAGISGPQGAPAAAPSAGPSVALAGGIPAIFVLTLFPGGLLRLLIPNIAPAAQLRQTATALAPGGMMHRLQRSLDPREILSPERLMRLPRWRARLPRGHRPPRR